MIQFNLLPDVKIAYIKARRMKRLIATVASLVTVGAVALTALLFVYVSILQSNHLKDVSKQISEKSKTLKNTEDLDKILTVQNQLKSLSALHASKPVTSRYFSFLSQLTPANVSLATSTLDFETNTVVFTGSADSLARVNTFVDTLKFTKYSLKADETKTEKNAFSGVVLTTFGRDDKKASYTINATFDPAIFGNYPYDPTLATSLEQVTLIVPEQTTTRSETAKPDSLFQPLPATTTTTTTPSTNGGSTR